MIRRIAGENWCTKLCVGSLLVFGWPLAAFSFEVGAQFGVVSSFADKDSRFITISIPSTRALYLKWFPSQYAAFGPYAYLGYTWTNDDYPNSWYRRLGGIMSYYPRGHNQDGYYIEGEIGGYFPSGDKDATVGIGLGYQTMKERPFVWQVKIDYSRWIDGNYNEIGLSLVLGRRGGLGP